MTIPAHSGEARAGQGRSFDRVGPSAAVLTWPASSFCVQVAVPSELLPASSTDPADFERVWSRLPEVEVENRLAVLDESGGLFVKGQQPRHRGRATHPWRRARLLREVRILRRLAGLGLPVPDPIAWGEERRAGTIGRSFAVLPLIREAEGLDDFLRDPCHGAAERRQALHGAGVLIRRLHEVDLFHRDIAARNVLVRPTRSGPEASADAGTAAWLIDCNRTEERRWGPRRSFLRRSDLFRMTRSLARLGASPEEIDVMLDAAQATREERDVIHSQLRVPGALAGPWPWRTNLWLMLGTWNRGSGL